MVTQRKVSNHSNFRTFLDIVLLNSGILLGGLAAFVTLWLWFDYQAEPNHSLLALINTNLATIIPPSLRSFIGYETQMMGLPLTGSTPAYWYMARAGGIVAYLLLWFSTVWGMILSTRATDRLIPAPLAYGLHEFLAILALLFSGLHAVVLFGDAYIQFSIFDLTIPFLAPYKPGWTGLGIIGLYLSLALTASFYVRKQIGQKVWRRLHYLTFVAYLLVLGHGMMAGTDSSLAVMKLLYLGTGLSLLFLIFYRLVSLGAKR